MPKKNSTVALLFLLAGLAGAFVTFFISGLDFWMYELYYIKGVLGAWVIIEPFVCFATLCIFLLYRFAFKQRKLLIPLFFSLSVVFTFIFAVCFYLFSLKQADFIFIFLLLPAIMAAEAWLFYLAYFLIIRFGRRKPAKN